MTSFLCCAVLAHAADTLRVAVSLRPIEGLVRIIGGEAVEVHSLQGEGDSCSIFEPRPSAIAALADVDLYFKIGAAFEGAILPKVASRFPGIVFVDLREGIALISADGHDHHHHHGECDHFEDPHVWLDPLALQTMVSTVAQSLGEQMPRKRILFEQRARDFQARLAAVHTSLSDKLKTHSGKAFYIYHPSLGYFAQRYGLNQISIETSESGPSIKGLHQFVSRAEQEDVQAILVQPQESRRHAEIVANAIGSEIIAIDPMSTDLIGNLEHIGITLANVLSR